MSYLVHHGIKGQKWGVRRFQNKDGTRTSAGKKREAALTKNDNDNKYYTPRSSKDAHLYIQKKALKTVVGYNIGNAAIGIYLNKRFGTPYKDFLKNAPVYSGLIYVSYVLADEIQYARTGTVRRA